MIWRAPRLSDYKDPGARFRAEHSAWLTRAFRSGLQYPRIPAKPTMTGGFERLMKLPTGPMRTERWWTIALGRIGLGRDR